MTNTYTTASLVEADIRASTAFSSSTSPTLTQVNNWILEESAIIDARAGTIFGSTLVSSDYYDYDGCGIFRFPESPLITLTSLEYNVNAMGVEASWITLEEGFNKNYLLYEDEAEVEFISGQDSVHKITPKAGKKKFRATYSYGYSSTPLEVQRLATLGVSKRVMMSLLNSQANTQGGNIQVGTISVTDPSNYGVGWFKSVNAEIDALYNAIGENLKVFRLTRRYD